MDFAIFQDTDIGTRASNQDRMGYCFTREALLMLVADGMGGHLRGEVAAQLSMEAAGALFRQAARPRLPDPEAFLRLAFLAGHRELHRYRDLNGLSEVPRTTIVACVIQDDLAWWAHAGDSRLYLARRGRLLMRTRDHSKVETLLRQGVITEAQAASHPERNKVLNCLGSPFDPSIEVRSRIPLFPGDAILLCSDGFWSGVDESEMATALAEEPVGDLVPRLVRRAVQCQGAMADNTTALALQWDAAPTGMYAVGATGLSSRRPPEGLVVTATQVGDNRAPQPEADHPERILSATNDHT
jgi:protein phosphatase